MAVGEFRIRRWWHCGHDIAAVNKPIRSITETAIVVISEGGVSSSRHAERVDCADRPARCGGSCSGQNRESSAEAMTGKDQLSIRGADPLLLNGTSKPTPHPFNSLLQPLL